MNKKFKNSKNVIIWTIVWLISFAFLVLGPKELWQNTTITAIAALVNFILIIAMLFANKNQFDNFDEFEKTVQLNAIALSLFLTIFVGLFFIGIYKSGLMNYEPQIDHLVVFSALTYIFSTIFIFKKYQ
tara:strand:- start:115 stop:501 length:387 start_codon:yes stop_codon:yes gene_type:complete